MTTFIINYLIVFSVVIIIGIGKYFLKKDPETEKKKVWTSGDPADLPKFEKLT